MYNENINKLPLTYYGPSTSTFQCEPYSFTHRALLGSFLSNEIMCKCNSNREKQNPLCQKCGEAMCTPKPSKSKKNTQIKTIKESFKNTKEMLNSKNNEKITYDEIDKNVESAREVSDSKATKEISNKNTIISSIDNTNKSFIGAGDGVNSEKNRLNAIIKDEMISTDDVECKKKITENKCTFKISELNETDECNIDKVVVGICESADKPEKKTKEENELIEVTCGGGSGGSSSSNNNSVKENENDSSQNDKKNNNTLQKSKSKKKKSKDRKKKEKKVRTPFERFEPLKVVHAEKYIHPTSVEPKIKTENENKSSSQVKLNQSGNNQFKAFVPNRRCLSTQSNDSGSYLVKSLSKKNIQTNDGGVKLLEEEISSRFSNEGNKENCLKNASNVNVNDNIDKINSRIEIKKEIIDSAFEFVKTWEEVKKFDPSYVKRAEIIRLIKPGDLGKGNYLSLSLSLCFHATF